MKYEPLTPEKFAEKLKAGIYESLTGARRAVGKAAWNDAQRDKARKQAEAHFGTEGAPAPKKVAAKKPVTGSPKKASAKAAPAKKAAAVAATPKRAPAQARTVEASPEIAAHVAASVKPLTAADIRKNPFQTIQLAEHAVQSGTSVLNALTEAKKQHPSLETSAAHEQAINTIQSALKLTSAVIDKLSEGMSVPDAIKEGISAKPVNGATSHEDVTPGSTQYLAPTAEA